MSRSAGTGSPVFFRCWRARQRDYHPRGYGVTLTGRSRPFKPKRGSALGSRSAFRSFEYVCDCGYTGWSNHIDLAYRALREGMEGAEDALRWRLGERG